MLTGRKTSPTAETRPRVALALVFLLLSVGSLGLSARLGAAEELVDRKVIVFFGDSLTAGYGLDNPGKDAYPAVIQEKILAARLPWRVVNAGLSGETSAGGSRRVDWVLRQPVDLFVLALGGNDGLRGLEPAITRRNLASILARVRTAHPAAKLVVAGVQMPSSMGEDYEHAFRAIFPALAEEQKAVLVPSLLQDVGGIPELNQGDGIHPTREGHAILAANLWHALEPLLKNP